MVYSWCNWSHLNQNNCLICYTFSSLFLCHLAELLNMLKIFFNISYNIVLMHIKFVELLVINNFASKHWSTSLYFDCTSWYIWYLV